MNGKSVIHAGASVVFVAWVAFLPWPAPADAAEAAQAAPRTLAGALKGTDQDGGKAANVLGRHGALLFRSGARWGSFQEKLAALGWQKPNEHPLINVDFGHEMVACVFQYGDEGSTFALRGAMVAGDEATVDVVMGYIIYKSHGETANTWKFFAAAVPAAKTAKVSVSTYHPMNGGPYPTPDKARLDWSAVLGGEAGDVSDNLQGSIRAKGGRVKAGEDILVELTLRHAAPSVVQDDRFAPDPRPVRVWDGKYSNGYRNHAFLVRTPDGREVLLRRPVVDAWDKNAPHLVEVAPGKPYVLPEWAGGEAFKSLKALGLDTSKPGTYAITGIYQETGGPGGAGRGAGPVWGGEIATNTVVVEVE